MGNHSTSKQTCECHAGLKDTFFCAFCERIQDVEIRSPFSCFELKDAYQIDLEHLKKRYLFLQRKLHPDRFVLASGEEKELSARYTARLNWAYRILNNSFSRADYLLSNIDADISLEDLQDQMMRQEKIEQLSTTEDLKRFYKNTQQEENALKDKLSIAFNEKDMLTAKKYLIQIKYFKKLSIGIEKKINKV